MESMSMCNWKNEAQEEICCKSTQYSIASIRTAQLAILIASLLVVLQSSLLFAQTPKTKLNLAPAVEDTRQVFRDHGLPVDWYASLKPDAKESDPLFLTGIWTMVGPPAAEKFQQRFRTKRAPTSNLYVGAVETNNSVFEEVALLALIGPNHEHRRFAEIQLQQFLELPNVDPKFLKADGTVKFATIRDALVARFAQGPPLRTVNIKQSVANEADEYCHLVGEWQSPMGSPPDWASKQLGWRFVVRVEFVSGTRKVLGLYIQGQRRLVIDSYVQIGYRRNVSQEFSPIYFAGPFHETAYQPVGKASVGLAAWKLTVAVGTCKQSFVQSDLDSLNRELTADEQKKIAQAAADKSPLAERPNLTSVTSRPDIMRLHKDLHEVLAAGKPSVPVLNLPEP